MAIVSGPIVARTARVVGEGHILDERRVPDIPRSLWQRIHDDPARAPEHIALAAAERFAPPADRWARRMHDHHPPAELGHVARSQHVNLARLEGGLAGLGGAFTVALDLAALATVCDLVPLRDENRRIAREGVLALSRMSSARCRSRRVRRPAR